jgi:hypothetical protein
MAKKQQSTVMIVGRAGADFTVSTPMRWLSCKEVILRRLDHDRKQKA